MHLLSPRLSLGFGLWGDERVNKHSDSALGHVLFNAHLRMKNLLAGLPDILSVPIHTLIFQIVASPGQGSCMAFHLILILGLGPGKMYFCCCHVRKLMSELCFGQLGQQTHYHQARNSPLPLATLHRKLNKEHRAPNTEQIRRRTSKILFQVKSKVIKTANG